MEARITTLCLYKARLVINTKEQILKKAKKLFAKHGFDGVSIRSICEKADCNVSAISYHFGSKEELYRACLCGDGLNVIQLMDQILLPVEGKDDFKAKLRLFLLQLFEHNVQNKEVIHMISKDVSSKLAIESLHKIFHRIPEKLTEFFQTAIDRGVVRSDLDPKVLGDIITQPLFIQTLFSEASKFGGHKNVSDPTYRAHFIDQLLSLIFESILVR